MNYNTKIMDEQRYGVYSSDTIIVSITEYQDRRNVNINYNTKMMDEQRFGVYSSDTIIVSITEYFDRKNINKKLFN